MTAKHTLRKSMRVQGKMAGQVLVEWLNCEGSYQGKKRTAAHHRIEALLDEWHSLTQRPAHYWDGEEWGRFHDLQKKLSHYRMSPQIDPKAIGGLGMRFLWNPGRNDDAKAVLIITWLGERALLWRVRRCGHGTDSLLVRRLEGSRPDCEKWFYARRKDQQFCSPSCRKGMYSPKTKTPEARAKRKEYMRKYRANLRDRDNLSPMRFGTQNAVRGRKR